MPAAAQLERGGAVALRERRVAASSSDRGGERRGRTTREQPVDAIAHERRRLRAVGERITALREANASSVSGPSASCSRQSRARRPRAGAGNPRRPAPAARSRRAPTRPSSTASALSTRRRLAAAAFPRSRAAPRRGFRAIASARARGGGRPHRPAGEDVSRHSRRTGALEIGASGGLQHLEVEAGPRGASADRRRRRRVDPPRLAEVGVLGGQDRAPARRGAAGSPSSAPAVSWSGRGPAQRHTSGRRGG